MRESESDVQIVEPAQANPQELSAFLDEAFGPVKGRFLVEHGDWWHKGPGGRFVALCDGVIAGYRGMIPSLCFFAGRELPAVWAVDLYVTPRFRGKGLQRLLDQRLLEGTGVRLSFPNQTAAKIYVRQGYGLRDDLQMLSVPLYPRSWPGVLRRSGSQGRVIRAGAAGLSPLAAAFRARAARYRPKQTEIASSLDTREAEELFRSSATSGTATTLRSEDFLRWRYLEAPYRQELAFFLTGSPGRRTHYAIVRYVRTDASVRARILDVCGDFDAEEGLADLMRTMLRDAALRGATDIGALAGPPKLARAMRSAGFLIRHPVLFRWLADEQSIHEHFSSTRFHWTLGDSDLDSPDQWPELYVRG
jgi:GNAT superfamily N-acetyltransferase